MSEHISEQDAVNLINHHCQVAIDVSKATGAPPSLHILYELRMLFPPENKAAEAAAAKSWLEHQASNALA